VEVSNAAGIVCLASGLRLWGIDALGWGMTVFVLLLFGIPYTRYFLRRSEIPSWPITNARITDSEVRRGLPDEYIPQIANIDPYVHAVVPFHCRAQYVYLVDGATYSSWFALFAMSQPAAQEFAVRLAAQTILVKYDPRNPEDSVLEEPRMFDQKVIQADTNPLNPKVC
jgi:hypothetical protein